jgi:hypothetical protein
LLKQEVKRLIRTRCKPPLFRSPQLFGAANGRLCAAAIFTNHLKRLRGPAVGFCDGRSSQLFGAANGAAMRGGYFYQLFKAANRSGCWLFVATIHPSCLERLMGRLFATAVGARCPHAHTRMSYRRTCGCYAARALCCKRPPRDGDLFEPPEEGAARPGPA